MFRFGGLIVCLCPAPPSRAVANPMHLGTATLPMPEERFTQCWTASRVRFHLVMPRRLPVVCLRTVPSSTSPTAAIRGIELQQVLETFYATQTRIDFGWDSIALSPLTGDVWKATAWARITLTDSASAVTTAPAIFTWTVCDVEAHGSWRWRTKRRCPTSSQGTRGSTPAIGEPT